MIVHRIDYDQRLPGDIVVVIAPRTVAVPAGWTVKTPPLSEHFLLSYQVVSSAGVHVHDQWSRGTFLAYAAFRGHAEHACDPPDEAELNQIWECPGCGRLYRCRGWTD